MNVRVRGFHNGTLVYEEDLSDVDSSRLAQNVGNAVLNALKPSSLVTVTHLRTVTP